MSNRILLETDFPVPSEGIIQRITYTGPADMALYPDPAGNISARFVFVLKITSEMSLTYFFYKT